MKKYETLKLEKYKLLKENKKLQKIQFSYDSLKRATLFTKSLQIKLKEIDSLFDNTANTAINTSYFTEKEKKVLFYINVVRKHPKEFANYFYKTYYNSSDPYVTSLYQTLISMESKSYLIPDREAFNSAECHALSTGKAGIVSHNRIAGCVPLDNIYAECCQYGSDEPFEIVLQLLIDSGVPSLGHRKMLLGLDFFGKHVGIKIAHHSVYGSICVIDGK